MLVEADVVLVSYRVQASQVRELARFLFRVAFATLSGEQGRSLLLLSGESVVPRRPSPRDFVALLGILGPDPASLREDWVHGGEVEGPPAGREKYPCHDIIVFQLGSFPI